MAYEYIIVGGGLAAASAVEGIRAQDRAGRILFVSRENHPPYHRPPLSKGLWFGKSKLDELPVHDTAFYRDNGVELQLRREVVEIDPVTRRVWDDHGAISEYRELLLATGGWPRRLNVEGAETEGIHYYRTLEDYLALENRLDRFSHALVVGAGFIGVEIAAALAHKGKGVTLLYPDEYPLHHVLPRDLGLFVAEYYRDHGVEAVSGERVIRFEAANGQVLAFTANHNQVATEQVIVGIGLEPATDLAEAVGIQTGTGIEVDEYGRTNDAHVWAAGDVAEFPYVVLDDRMRIEHWDHAMQHGKAVGANMAGAHRPYTHLPFFYSDLFDLGFEAVGEVDSRLDTHAVWKQEFREGVVFYLRDDVIRGVLLWNVWEKVDWARRLIREKKTLSGAELEALVKAE